MEQSQDVPAVSEASRVWLTSADKTNVVYVIWQKASGHLRYARVGCESTPTFVHLNSPVTDVQAHSKYLFASTENALIFWTPNIKSSATTPSTPPSTFFELSEDAHIRSFCFLRRQGRFVILWTYGAQRKAFVTLIDKKADVLAQAELGLFGVYDVGFLGIEDDNLFQLSCSATEVCASLPDGSIWSAELSSQADSLGLFEKKAQLRSPAVLIFHHGESPDELHCVSCLGDYVLFPRATVAAAGQSPSLSSPHSTAFPPPRPPAVAPTATPLSWEAASQLPCGFPVVRAFIAGPSSVLAVSPTERALLRVEPVETEDMVVDDDHDDDINNNNDNNDNGDGHDRQRGYRQQLNVTLNVRFIDLPQPICGVGRRVSTPSTDQRDEVFIHVISSGGRISSHSLDQVAPPANPRSLSSRSDSPLSKLRRLSDPAAEAAVEQLAEIHRLETQMALAMYLKFGAVNLKCDITQDVHPSLVQDNIIVCRLSADESFLCSMWKASLNVELIGSDTRQSKNTEFDHKGTVLSLQLECPTRLVCAVSVHLTLRHRFLPRALPIEVHRQFLCLQPCRESQSIASCSLFVHEPCIARALGCGVTDIKRGLERLLGHDQVDVQPLTKPANICRVVLQCTSLQRLIGLRILLLLTVKNSKFPAAEPRLLPNDSIAQNIRTAERELEECTTSEQVLTFYNKWRTSVTCKLPLL